MIQEAVDAAAEPSVSLPVSAEPGVAAAGDVAGVAVMLPEDPGKGIVVMGASSELISVMLPDAAVGEAMIANSVVSYVGPSASTVPLVAEDGTVQILSVLTDPNVVPELTYVIRAASGGSIVSTADGGFAVVDGEGEEVATAAAPWAKDSAGNNVPTRYDVSGSTVTQVVDTSGLTSDRFPVVADPALSVSGYEYVAANVTTRSQQPNYNKLIGGCRVGIANSTCTITGSYTVGATVNASLGISASQVAATLGISATASVTGSMGCTSPKMAAGTSYRAYILGKYRYFTLQKWKVSKNGGVTARKLQSTAYNQVAFSPINMIYCTR